MTKKNGCRSEWSTFCSNSRIPGFKANRFNCFFQAAAALIHHLPQILTFFTSGILHENPNRLVQSVTLDSQDKRLLCLVSAVALFYLKVTGPYWNLVNSHIKYTDFHKYVQSMALFFQQWSSDPSQLLDHNFISVFDDIAFKAVEFKCVHEFLANNDENLIHRALMSRAKGTYDVTRRQLSDFLTDGYYSSADTEIQSQLLHCPLTNLVGESAFGDLDFDFSRRRNVGLHNRSALHALKRNNTMLYLKKKTSAAQRHIFQIARQEGPLLRKENRKREEEVKDAIRAKFVQNQDLKIVKKMKEITRTDTIRANVEDHGGPCQTSEDVDHLLSTLK